MYLLPAIDILGGKAVRLAKGDYAQVTTYNENPVDQARIFEEAGAEWVHVVDLDGAKSGKPENAAVIEAIVRSTGLKVEIGGGIRSMDTCRRLFEAGASRLVLGTALVRDPEFAQQAVEEFGGDRLSAGIDAKDGEVAVTGWTEGSGIAAAELGRRMGQLGYCHMVYTDIARDGMQTGIDPAMYTAMAEAFGHPVIASGGVANLDDIANLAKVKDAIEGIITGRAIYEGSLPLVPAIKACLEA